MKLKAVKSKAVDFKAAFKNMLPVCILGRRSRGQDWEDDQHHRHHQEDIFRGEYSRQTHEGLDLGGKFPTSQLFCRATKQEAASNAAKKLTRFFAVLSFHKTIYHNFFFI